MDSYRNALLLNHVLPMAISRKALLATTGVLILVILFFSASQTSQATFSGSSELLRAKLGTWHLSDLTDGQNKGLEFDSNGRPIVDVDASILSAQVPPAPPAVPQEEENVENVWRTHLESQHSPYEASSLSEDSITTLGFSHIYVISTPGQDSKRRERMMKLGRALGVDFTFVEAIKPDSSVLIWIAERVKDIRERKRKTLAKELDLDAENVGGLQAGSVWLQPAVEVKQIKHHRYSVSAVFASANTVEPAFGTITFPSLRKDEDRWDGLDWVTYLDSNAAFQMDPNDPQLDIATELHDPLEPEESLQASAESLAQWYNHVRVYKKMKENNDESALVLEDVIDAEWDVERLWASIRRHLPMKSTNNLSPWEITYLGHCGGQEQSRKPESGSTLLLHKLNLPADPVYLHPLLHRAASPRCLYGYALSRTGLTNLLHLLSDPWSAYQTHLDVALATYIQAEIVNGFAIDPPVIAHLPDSLLENEELETIPPSPLGDSTLERIYRDEGRTIEEAELRPPDRQDPSEYRLSSVVKKPTRPQAAKD